MTKWTLLASLLVALVCAVPLSAAGQQDNGNGRKQAQAVRVPSGAINVDGRLDESAWRDIPALTEFVQREPDEGARATDRMEVRFADDGRDLQEAQFEPEANITWPNFWETEFGGSFNRRSQDLRLTRGGPSMERPAGWEVGVDVQNSDASETRGEFSLAYGRNEDGGLGFETEAQVSVRPGPQWELSVALHTSGRSTPSST